jgi:acyl carrier protein
MPFGAKAGRDFMNQPVADRVRQIAADVFNLPVDRVTDDLSPRTVADWDSMQHLNLVLAMEAQLGVRFDPLEIEQMVTIGQAIRFASERVGG